MTQLRPPRAALLAAIGALLAGLLSAGPSWGESAAIPDLGPERARLLFDRFAGSWMERLQRLESRNRQQPTFEPGSTNLTFRGYAEDFETELRATGNPQAPFVGLIRYVEYVYHCRDAGADAGRCRVTTSIPVTEIFRFRDGRWIY